MTVGRENQIYTRAYELAASGQHIDVITIVSALVQEGYDEAPDLLQGDIIRSDLRAVCRLHWHDPAQEPPSAPAVFLAAQPENAATPDEEF
jgi:hypothetical protein